MLHLYFFVNSPVFFINRSRPWWTSDICPTLSGLSPWCSSEAILSSRILSLLPQADIAHTLPWWCSALCPKTPHFSICIPSWHLQMFSSCTVPMYALLFGGGGNGWEAPFWLRLDSSPCSRSTDYSGWNIKGAGGLANKLAPCPEKTSDGLRYMSGVDFFKPKEEHNGSITRRNALWNALVTIH